MIAKLFFEMTDDFQWDFLFFVKNFGNPSLHHQYCTQGLFLDKDRNPHEGNCLQKFVDIF
jgi:hypothetical protein